MLLAAMVNATVGKDFEHREHLEMIFGVEGIRFKPLWV